MVYSIYRAPRFPGAMSLLSTNDPADLRHQWKERLGGEGGGSPAAISNSPSSGRVKIPHLAAAGRVDDYALWALLASRAADSFSRQLFPSNFSR
jgi:hypothetical protein